MADFSRISKVNSALSSYTATQTVDEINLALQMYDRFNERGSAESAGGASAGPQPSSQQAPSAESWGALGSNNSTQRNNVDPSAAMPLPTWSENPLSNNSATWFDAPPPEEIFRSAPHLTANPPPVDDTVTIDIQQSQQIPPPPPPLQEPPHSWELPAAKSKSRARRHRSRSRQPTENTLRENGVASEPRKRASKRADERDSETFAVSAEDASQPVHRTPVEAQDVESVRAFPPPRQMSSRGADAASADLFFGSAVDPFRQSRPPSGSLLRSGTSPRMAGVRPGSFAQSAVADASHFIGPQPRADMNKRLLVSDDDDAG